MKLHNKVLTCVLPIALLSGIATAQPLWSEEFNDGTLPDGTVWSYDLGASGWGNNELQNYTSDSANARIENGHLIITGREQINGNNRTFTSARLKTEHKVTVQYGTIEARIKTPDLGNGLWPAFWFLGNNFSSVGWPDCGEIDLMEMGSAAAISSGVVNRRVYSTAHWERNNGYTNNGRTLDLASDLDGSFHLYRIEWTPTQISTYIDSNWIWSMDISDPDAIDGHEFHQPHFMIVNMAIGGNFPGIWDDDDITAAFPAELAVDYIRVYDNGFTQLGGSKFGSSTTLSDFSNFQLSGTYADWDFGTFTSGADDFRVEAANFGGGWKFMDAPLDASDATHLEVVVTANPANVTSAFNVVLFSGSGTTEAGFRFDVSPGTQTLIADLSSPDFFNAGDINTWDPGDLWDQWHIQGTFENGDWMDLTFDNLAVIGGSGSGLTFTIDSACPNSGAATMTATGGSGGDIAFVYASGVGSFVIPGGFTCAGTELGLAGPPTVGGTASGDPAVLNLSFVPSGACGTTFVQAIDITTCETSNVVAF